MGSNSDLGKVTPPKVHVKIEQHRQAHKARDRGQYT